MLSAVNISDIAKTLIGVAALAAAAAISLGGYGDPIPAQLKEQAAVQEVPSNIMAFATEFNEHQLMHNLDYNKFDEQYQPALDGMETCWQVDEGTLTYVMKQGESYYASQIAFAGDNGGVNKVIGSGTNDARWNICVHGTSAEM